MCRTDRFLLVVFDVMRQRFMLTWVCILSIGLTTTRGQDRSGGSKSALLTAEQAQALHFIFDVQFTTDGKRIAFTVGLPAKGVEPQSQIWVMDVASRALRQFTASTKSNRMARWSPDGKRLAFLSNRDGQPQIYVMHTDGGEAERLTQGKNAVRHIEWSPDGKTIAFLAPEPKSEVEAKKEADKNDVRLIRADKAPRLWVVDVAT